MATATATVAPTLYRVVEVDAPGILPPGRYVAIRAGRVIMDVELERPTNPRDLIPAVKARRRVA